MVFIYPALAGAFALVSLPVLIHLINMLRHRRVKWAAMDFLLQSHRRMKHWVMLRQLLLLLTRMAAIALIVAMLAGLITTQSWSNMFSDRVTHHVILLDDSFSMGERLGGDTAFQSGVQTTTRIIEKLASQDRPQRISVMLYSDVLRSEVEDKSHGLAMRMRVDMDSTSIAKLQELLGNIAATEQDIPLPEVLQRASQLVSEMDQSESAKVYIVSDFREKDWGSESLVLDSISRIEENSSELNWINCARLPQDNLAITGVEIGSGTVVAGIPTIVKVSIRNFGQQTMNDVPVSVEMFSSESNNISDAGNDLAIQYDQMPITFDEIPPGDQVTRQTQVIFPAQGSHVLSFHLPEDALALDNQRFATCPVHDTIPVLIVDGDPKLTSAFYLQSVFNPGPSVSTGIMPTTSSTSFLTTANASDLQKFETLFIIDPPQLDERIVTTLTQYVQAGGNIVWFCGPGSSEIGLTELSKANLIPATLQAPQDLPQNIPDGPPDFVPGSNPVFKVFAGEKNPFLRRLIIDRYFPVAPDFKTEKPADVQILGSLRNGDPLVLEHPIGQGKVVTFLSSLGPKWNTWATNPSFIVMILELRNFAGKPGDNSGSLTVGAPISVVVPSAEYEVNGNAKFNPPGINRLPSERSEDARFEPVQGTLDSKVVFGGIDRVTGEFRTGKAGVYEAWLTKMDGSNEVRHVALVPEVAESDILGMNETNLRQIYPSVTFNYFAADAWQYDDAAQQGTNWQMILLALVVGALLLEQVLAYYASYHPAAPGATAA